MAASASQNAFVFPRVNLLIGPIIRPAWIATAGPLLLTLAAGGMVGGGAQAADQGSDRRVLTKAVKLKAKPKAELPFFFINDNRITYSWYRGGIPRIHAESQRQLGDLHPFRCVGVRHQLLRAPVRNRGSFGSHRPVRRRAQKRGRSVRGCNIFDCGGAEHLGLERVVSHEGVLGWTAH